MFIYVSFVSCYSYLYLYFIFTLMLIFIAQLHHLEDGWLPGPYEPPNYSLLFGLKEYRKW